jgi:hypothetical protein
MNDKIAEWSEKMELTADMRYHLDLHRDSDSESDNEGDEKLVEETRLRRMYREREAKHLLGKDAWLIAWLSKCSIPYQSLTPIFLFCRIILVRSPEILSKSLYCQQGWYIHLFG